MHPPPRVSGILETALYVADLAVSEAFYRRVMGFTTLLSEDRMRGMEVPSQGVLLLFRRGGSTHGTSTPIGFIPGHDGHGPLHLAFAVPRGELQAWEAHLAAENIAVESRVTWKRGVTSLYFRDPDGHSLEVATPGLWANY